MRPFEVRIDDQLVDRFIPPCVVEYQFPQIAFQVRNNSIHDFRGSPGRHLILAACRNPDQGQDCRERNQTRNGHRRNHPSDKAGDIEIDGVGRLGHTKIRT